jgi:cyclic-di-AMP phosphodiesterase PgpH
LLDVELSIFLLLLNAIFMGITYNLPFNFIAFMVLLGVGTTFVIFQIESRKDFAKAGVSMGIIASSVIIILEFMSGNVRIESLALYALVGFFNGVSSAVITMGILPYIEDFFSILTKMKLIDLSDQNSEIMKELLNKAPGTYHHSLMVANLSEQAAIEVGADPLLVRVAAYYHDLGKMKRPMFFIENSTKGNNPHNKITPQLSALIILSHPKDGMELAKKYKLPRRIVEIIGQHHGTSILSYFYYKILQQKDVDIIDETQFRYSGEKPKSKEAVILMLADAVEAAVRSIHKMTPNKIDTMIRKLIKDKFDDGQFEDADVTMKDIDTIRSSLLSTLQGIYHSRIEYQHQDAEVSE